uniref:Uncharacterized protein n=1 Tax=Oryza punctata TaxID=4537 RepID=A0A0E0KN76_ORYPU
MSLSKDLAEQVEETSYPKRLALLRGLFYWLENVGQEHHFRPWTNQHNTSKQNSYEMCLAVGNIRKRGAAPMSLGLPLCRTNPDKTPNTQQNRWTGRFARPTLVPNASTVHISYPPHAPPSIPARASSCGTGRLKVAEAKVPYYSAAVCVILEGGKSRPACSLCALSSAPVRPASSSSLPARVLVLSGDIVLTRAKKRKRELELLRTALEGAIVESPLAVPISIRGGDLEFNEGSSHSITSDAGSAKAAADNVVHIAHALCKVCAKSPKAVIEFVRRVSPATVGRSIDWDLVHNKDSSKAFNECLWDMVAEHGTTRNELSHARRAAAARALQHKDAVYRVVVFVRELATAEAAIEDVGGMEGSETHMVKAATGQEGWAKYVCGSRSL